jgi:hypothetical protein
LEGVEGVVGIREWLKGLFGIFEPELCKKHGTELVYRREHVGGHEFWEIGPFCYECETEEWLARQKSSPSKPFHLNYDETYY